MQPARDPFQSPISGQLIDLNASQDSGIAIRDGEGGGIEMSISLGGLNGKLTEEQYTSSPEGAIYEPLEMCLIAKDFKVETGQEIELASPNARGALTVPSSELKPIQTSIEKETTSLKSESRANLETPKEEMAISVDAPLILSGRQLAAAGGFASGGLYILEGIYELSSSIYTMGMSENDPRYQGIIVAQNEFQDFDEALFYKSLEEDEYIATVFGMIGAIGPDVGNPSSKAKAGILVAGGAYKVLKYTKKEILELIRGSRRRIIKKLDGRKPKDTKYTRSGLDIQSFETMSESMRGLGHHQHHLIPKAIFINGPKNTKGIIGYIPTISLEKAEHLKYLHPELNAYLADRMNKSLNSLGELPDLTPQEVEAALKYCKDFYIKKGLQGFATAIDEFIEDTYNPVK